MADAGTSVTLIFYRVGPKWWEEPALNLIAAAAQMSAYTHVEIAIGEAPGQGGMMANVARIFNDQNGAEVTQRTGKNPGTPPLSPLTMHLPFLSPVQWVVLTYYLRTLVKDAVYVEYLHVQHRCLVD